MKLLNATAVAVAVVFGIQCSAQEASLYQAVVSGDFVLAERLIAEGHDPNLPDEYGQTPLHLAAARNNLPMAKLLIDEGANPNLPDKDGWTPLHLVDGPPMAKLLIDEGANINTRSGPPLGWTPLHSVVAQNNLPIAKLLIDEGANVNAADPYGQTPLHGAVGNDNLPMAKLLIDGGASVNAGDSDGQAPLRWAATQNSLPMAKLLIDEGANVNDGGNDRLTPLYWAAVNKNRAMLDMLFQAGAVDIATKVSNRKASDIWGCDAGYIGRYLCTPEDKCNRFLGVYIEGYEEKWTRVIRVPFVADTFCQRINQNWRSYCFGCDWGEISEHSYELLSAFNGNTRIEMNRKAELAVLAAAEAEIQWQQAYRRCSVFEWATPSSVVRNDDQCKPELRTRLTIETE